MQRGVQENCQKQCKAKQQTVKSEKIKLLITFLKNNFYVKMAVKIREFLVAKRSFYNFCFKNVSPMANSFLKIQPLAVLFFADFFQFFNCFTEGEQFF